LSFDVKSDIRPQVRQINHKNYDSNIFKNLEDEKTGRDVVTLKPSIKTFEQIRRLNPEISFKRDKVNISQLVGQSNTLS